MLEEKRTEFRVTTQLESKEENPRKDVVVEGDGVNTVYKLSLNLLPIPKLRHVLNSLQTAHLTLKNLNHKEGKTWSKSPSKLITKTKQKHQYSLEEDYRI